MYHVKSYERNSTIEFNALIYTDARNFYLLQSTTIVYDPL